MKPKDTIRIRNENGGIIGIGIVQKVLEDMTGKCKVKYDLPVLGKSDIRTGIVEKSDIMKRSR